MNYLVTGASGFVGKNLLQAFENHDNIQLFACNSSKDFSNQLTAKDGIIHLAGKAHDLKDMSNPAEYYTVNTELTKIFFDAFLNSSASTFIYFSSVKASADEVSGILQETDISNPKTHYGKSKLLAEEFILSKKIPESKRVYILRPCMIYGPGNKGNLKLLFDWVKKGYPWPLGAFDNQRSFCSIENIVFVIRELLTRTDIPSGIYNLADDSPKSTNFIIELIGDILDKKIKIINFPRQFIFLLAKFGDTFRLKLNSERLKKLTESYIVSNKHLIHALGKELPINSQDGLKKAFEEFKHKNS
jgi:nucleoside-diphosphate-sugar epimerase